MTDEEQHELRMQVLEVWQRNQFASTAYDVIGMVILGKLLSYFPSLSSAKPGWVTAKDFNMNEALKNRLVMPYGATASFSSDNIIRLCSKASMEKLYEGFVDWITEIKGSAEIIAGTLRSSIVRSAGERMELRFEVLVYLRAEVAQQTLSDINAEESMLGEDVLDALNNEEDKPSDN